jgi:hypothetical protein
MSFFNVVFSFGNTVADSLCKSLGCIARNRNRKPFAVDKLFQKGSDLVGQGFNFVIVTGSLGKNTVCLISCQVFTYRTCLANCRFKA